MKTMLTDFTSGEKKWVRLTSILLCLALILAVTGGAQAQVGDTTPPDTTVTSGPDPIAVFEPYAFEFTGSDDTGVASFECQITDLTNGVPYGWNPCTSPAEFSGFGFGFYMFEARAIDSAGNVDPTPAFWTWIVAPACNFLVPTIIMGLPGMPSEGTNGPDVIVGTAGPDLIKGNGGRDTICGMAGDDTIYGGAGDDYLNGLDGADTIYGEGGADQLIGWTGADTLDGGAANDSLEGNQDGDTLLGGGGVDNLQGGMGNDILRGGADNDTLVGGLKNQPPPPNPPVPDNDQMYGEGGNDKLTGGAAADFFSGGAGTDTATDFNPTQGDTRDNTIP